MKNMTQSVSAQPFNKKEYLLLLSLIIFTFIPSINQLIVDRLISIKGSDIITIAGQIEWFDLFNETLLSFLTVPMFFVFNKARNDNELSSRINNTFYIAFVLYTTVSLIIYFYASHLASYMNAPKESINYLKLETIGFIIGFVSSYIYTIFVVRGKYEYFVTLLIVKIILLSMGNLLLIPNKAETGIAITNITVIFIISAISIYLLNFCPCHIFLLDARFSVSDSHTRLRIKQHQ